MFCTSCGRENPSAAQFCHACGKPVHRTASGPEQEFHPPTGSAVSPHNKGVLESIGDRLSSLANTERLEGFSLTKDILFRGL
jgi:NMD protein affecting ribosome stability and mRNA decay